MRRNLGAREALVFLIERIENEPARLRWQNDDGWSRHAYTLGRWRSEAGALGEIEPRLLKIVTDALRRDLELRHSTHRQIYYQHHRHFWKEKARAFFEVAMDVLARRAGSAASVVYIADYVHRGLGRTADAVDALFAARDKGILEERGQWRLAEYLHVLERFGESIPVLADLIEIRPDNMRYRTAMMYAYFRTDQPAVLADLLAQTDAHFHEKDRWQQGALAVLARGVLRCELYAAAVGYYDELVPWHNRTRTVGRDGDHTLSEYYQNLASAHAGLGDTVDAVEAASGAIVCWPSNHHRRRDALNRLTDILRQSKDLGGYVRTLDEQVEDTGLENPIVRKAVGEVYRQRNAFDRAAVQYRKALGVQPNDAETHKAFIAMLDQQQDTRGVVDQLLAWRQLSPRDLSAYEDLIKRYEQLGEAGNAERARTSIVEALPSESESHTMLAEIRERQGHWDYAAVHWRHVVRIRSLEPTGHLRLAAAQIKLEQWDEARLTVDTLLKRDWPERFGDVQREARTLAKQIDRANR